MSDEGMSRPVLPNQASAGLNKALSILPWIICAVGALFYAYEYVLRIAPNVMTTQLMQYYDINSTGLGILIGFYYNAYTPMQIPVGVLMDRYGPRRLLTVACLLCAVGAYLFGSSHFLSIAGLGRFLAGFGSAFAFVGVLKLATIWLPPNRFAFIAGFTSALGAVGAVCGEVTLTPIVDTMGWRSSMMISALVGVLLSVLIFLVIKDGKHRELAKGSAEPLDLPQICMGFWSIFKNKYIWLNGLIGCLMYLPSSAFAEVWGKTYLQRAHMLSSQDAAWAISLVFLGFACGGPLFGWWSDVIKKRKLPMIVGACMATVIISIILYVPDLSKYQIMALLFIFGVNYGSQVIVFPIGRELSPGNLAGTAIAVTNMLVMLGGVIFQPAIGLLLDWGWSGALMDNVRVYSALDFKYALTVLPASLALSAFLLTFIKETNAKVSITRY